MKPTCLKGFVMRIGAVQRTFLSPSWSLTRGVVVRHYRLLLNDLSIRIVIRGRKRSIAKEPESDLALCCFSTLFFSLAQWRRHPR